MTQGRILGACDLPLLAAQTEASRAACSSDVHPMEWMFQSRNTTPLFRCHLSLAWPMVPAPTLRPQELDLSLSDSALRPACVHALNSLTPTLSLVNHGCEKKLRALAAAMQAQVVGEGENPKDYAQQAHDISGQLAPAADEVKSCLRAVALRVLGIALGSPEAGEVLGQHDLDLQGRLCLREYPRQQQQQQEVPTADAADAVGKINSEAVTAPSTASTASTPSTPSLSTPSPPSPPPPPPPPRLGAHCDSTLLTLLWADSPGLQVLDPARAEALGWRPEHVLGLGLPTMMAAPSGDDDGGRDDAAEPLPLTDSEWATIDLDWARDPLLCTLGVSWLSSAVVAERCPARCAALHRVVLPEGGPARHSLPFLADLVPAEGRREGEQALD